MLKKLSIILLTLLITLVQIPSLKASALDGTSELKVDSVLTQWTLDEPKNTLYAISQSGKKLFFINATTMKVEKTLAFNGNPTDIIKENGKLYVSLGDINQIAIIDMVSKTITKTIYTSSDPYRIEKDGDKIYYAQGDQWCGIYVYDLTTNTDERLPIENFYEPDIAINSKDHILYIGEAGLSGSNMSYYSTSENKIINKTNYNGGYGFPYPNRYTIFDGEKVYFAGYGFDKLNATRILGKYGNGDVIFVKYGGVFTKRGIYNGETYELIDQYDYDINLYEISSKGIVYLYSAAENLALRVDPEVVSKLKGWIQQNGKWYYYDLNTGLKKTGWLNDKGTWYYLNTDGSMATGWVRSGANWYYLQGSGAMKTGWLLNGGSWYYLNGDGSMKTGWLYSGGSWYYLNSSGDMKTGWILSGGKWYYLYNNGKMAYSTRISGYRLGSDGAWIN
jgi:hypothetical protein